MKITKFTWITLTALLLGGCTSIGPISMNDINDIKGTLSTISEEVNKNNLDMENAMKELEELSGSVNEKSEDVGKETLDNYKIIKGDYTYYSGYKNHYVDSPSKDDYRSIYKKNNTTEEVTDLLKGKEVEFNMSEITPISIVGDYLYFEKVNSYSNMIKINLITEEISEVELNVEFDKILR